MKIKHLFAVLITAAALYSCSTPKDIAYFQDVPTETLVQMAESHQIKLMPEDKISIVVNSKDPQLTAMFNLPSATRYIGATASASQNQSASLYTISLDGDIQFPVLGKIHVAGLSKTEVAAKIREMLVTSELVKDATVTVEYQNLMISVLGEVKTPGRFPFDRDRYSILDAIAQAGDLTITGKRQNVTVLRKEGDATKVYKLDLCNYNELVNSPAYYLQQGDYVYVEPNPKKSRDARVNGNNVMNISFWFSLVSAISSLTLIITRLK